MPVRLDSLRSQRLAAGHSITRLASLSNTSDLIINTLENTGTNGKGGTTDEYIAQRIADALGVSLATLGIARL